MKGGATIRISGGELRGQLIRCPPHFHSRPTQERVREAIFSSLSTRLAGARVLDLFAGSGALGIEALSRGAASASFIDNHPKCIHTIRANLTQCQLTGDVRRADASAFCRQSPALAYDLIFLDPPYDEVPAHLDDSPLLPLLHRLINKDGMIVWEHSSRASWKDEAEAGLTKTRRYGDSCISYLVRPATSFA